ncbi:MAG: DUF2950 domain-containing protein [Candidatus Korobacteraceae bacterium]
MKSKSHSYSLIGSFRSRIVALVSAIFAMLLALLVPNAFAQQGNEKTFSSPGDAVLAMYNAVKSGDQPTLNAILGSNAGQVLHTGDDVADKKMATDFIRRYDQMHRVVIEPDQSATLYVGAENWPMPIPIVKNSSGAWYFDTETGMKEILYRRIGTNENDAIDVLHTLVAAQLEYGSTIQDGDKAKHYALKFVSDEGKHNGLYWKTSDNETPSPIGPLLVDAAGQGYNIQQGKQTPFHGYYYRMLTAQGAAAKGGAHSYLVNGELVHGFAFVAYPAEYRNSGVMTFIVNQDGTIYEKDLGQDTDKLAGSMSDYNPDKTWNRVE